MIELALSLFAIVVWMIVTFRWRVQLASRWNEYGVMVVFVTLWVTLLALLVRALYDNALVGPSVAALSAAIVRGLFVIGGIALLFSPMRDDATKTRRRK